MKNKMLEKDPFMREYAPCVILVRPQMGENIGAAARAMFNFGLERLRIVAPRDGWPNVRATDMAAGALEKMPPVEVFETLQDAAADLHHLYATTARPRDMVKPVLTPAAAAADCVRRSAERQRTGFVFGAERAGLSNDEIALCQSIVNIPANPEFSSLNLGQAVLLLAYEHFQATANTPARQLDFGKSCPAPQAKLEEFLTRLEGELENSGFFRTTEQKPVMARNLRAMFTRAELSEQDVSTFHGIVTALIRHKKAPE